MTENLAQKVVEKLKSKKLTLSCAESCTGGMLSGAITSVSGASVVFPLGVVSYAGEMKRDVLKVPQTVLEKFGTISPDTAYYMAKGVQCLGKTDIGVSITGVAGPQESEGKPVGLVFVAVYMNDRAVVLKLTEASHLDREAIRNSAKDHALKLILKVIDQESIETDSNLYTLVTEKDYIERG